jgi:hypothetical protein
MTGDVVLGADFPLFGALATTLWFFFWIAWIAVVFRCLGDIFRCDDLDGGGKATWCFLVVAAPFVGVVVYLVARGNSMVQRDVDLAHATRVAKWAQDQPVVPVDTERRLIGMSEFRGRCAASHHSVRHNGASDVDGNGAADMD